MADSQVTFRGLDPERLMINTALVYVVVAAATLVIMYVSMDQCVLTSLCFNLSLVFVYKFYWLVFMKGLYYRSFLCYPLF